MTRGIRNPFLLMILAASAPAALAQTTMTWTVDGVQREALVFAPAPVLATNAQPVPLVFAFHGHGGTMKTAVASDAPADALACGHHCVSAGAKDAEPGGSARELSWLAGAGGPGGTERSRPEIFRCHAGHDAPEISCRSRRVFMPRDFPTAPSSVICSGQNAARRWRLWELSPGCSIPLST